VADKSITRRVYCNYVDAGISEKLAVMPILDRSIYHTGIDNRYEQGGNVIISCRDHKCPLRKNCMHYDKDETGTVAFTKSPRKNIGCNEYRRKKQNKGEK
jgi:hypothetical protein